MVILIIIIVAIILLVLASDNIQIVRSNDSKEKEQKAKEEQNNTSFLSSFSEKASKIIEEDDFEDPSFIDTKPKVEVPIQKNNQKHGFPAFFSFFLPGVGQLIKGHIFKAILIWIFGALIGVFLWWTLIIPFGFWAWNVYDAYNSN